MASANSLEQPLFDEVSGVSAERATWWRRSVMKISLVAAALMFIGLAGLIFLAPPSKDMVPFKSLEEKPTAVVKMFPNILYLKDANEISENLPANDREDVAFQHVIPHYQRVFPTYVGRPRQSEAKNITDGKPSSKKSQSNTDRGTRQVVRYYTHLAPGCVPGANIALYHGKTVQECAAICDAESRCKAFEYGVAHGGRGSYKPGDCSPQSSSNYGGCDGSYQNLDLYVKDEDGKDTTCDKNWASMLGQYDNASSDAEFDWEDEGLETIEMLEQMAQAGWDEFDVPGDFLAYTLNQSTYTANKQVSCGGHRRPTCAECPSGHGAGWCHGDCKWQRGKCVMATPDPSPENPYGCPPPVNGLWPGGKCRKRTSSVWTRWKRPSAARAPTFVYNEVKVLKTSTASYFSTVIHGYGYAGIQTIAKGDGEHGQQVLCSIWDQKGHGDTKTVHCGKGVKCTGFGGEGTGAKAYWRGFKWTVGKTYAFVLRRAKLETGKVEHTCWFYAEELAAQYPGGWKHIATTVSSANRYGYTFKDLQSFVEQFTYKDSQDQRRADFGPVFYKNANACWSNSLRAQFRPGCARSGKEVCNFHEACLAGSGRVVMATGGLSPYNKGHSPKQLPPLAPMSDLPSPLYAFELHEDVLVRDSQDAVPPAWSMSCGGHRSKPTCPLCPQGHGRLWCNGDCTWKGSSTDHGQCIKRC